MRTAFLTFSLLLSTFASGAAVPSIASPTLKVVGSNPQPAAYQMLCRGGTSRRLQFTTANTRVGPNREQIVTYEMGFTPGRRAAGPKGSGLEPGQCSWIDRPLNDKEPYLIRFDTPLNAQLKQKLDSSPTAAERYPDAYTIPEYLKDQNHYWSFLVYNNAKEGYLQATANKYFRSIISKEGEIRRPPR